MRRTISFKGEVLYIVERKLSSENSDDSSVSANECKKVEQHTNEWHNKQWINPDNNKLKPE